MRQVANRPQVEADMKFDQHRQRGTVILIALPTLAAVLTGISIHWDFHGLWVVPILLGTAWLFHSLTVAITDGELRWHFGPGLIRKRIALRQIASARVVRTGLMDGWGIHFGRYGWLYNVSGKGAVAITLRDGKRFALGTDEPHVVLDHLALVDSAPAHPKLGNDV